MIQILRCYDSHLHLIPTGEMLSLLNLRGLDDHQKLLEMKPAGEARRGRWLMGFGWDSTRWQQQPDRQMLDQVFKDEMVAFSRIDGHCLWFNTLALQELGFWKEKSQWNPEHLVDVDFDSEGWPTGLVRDRVFEIAYRKLPKLNEMQMKSAALSAIVAFRNQGFTHLRDMMADRSTWNVLQKLDENRDLKAYVEVNFHCPSLNDLPAVIRDYQEALAYRSPRLRAAGIKIFLDGAMGSEGALLTDPYLTGDRCKHGSQLWSQVDLEQGFSSCWQNGIPVAVHVIGDHAARLALQSAQNLRAKSVEGLLHLEHLQMLNPKDLALFQDLSVFCHFQPSHFLADQRWIKEKLGERASWIYPWKKLEMHGYPFFFGSDSPIESPSLKKTKDGLVALQRFGQKGLEMDWTYPHSHPDSSFGKKCFSEVTPEGELLAVILDGERVL